MSEKNMPVLRFDDRLQRLVYNREAPISAAIFQNVLSSKPRAITLPRADVFHLMERIHAILDCEMPDEYIREHFPLPGHADRITALNALGRYCVDCHLILGELASWLYLRPAGVATSFGAELPEPFRLQLTRVHAETPDETSARAGAVASSKRGRLETEAKPAGVAPAAQKRAKESDE